MAAARFHDGQHGITHAARVVIFGRELRIVGQDDNTMAVWKLSAVRAAPEPDPDGAVALTARDATGLLLVDDAADLDALSRAGVRLPGQRSWTWGHWVTICAGLVGAVTVLLLALNELPHWIATAIPPSWEQRFGAPAEALISGGMKRCTEPDGQAALDGLVRRLRTAGGITMPVTIEVVDKPTINAFTLPGGHVLVMRGLIEAADDGAVLAGVIAHELGHVAHRDSTTLLVRGMGVAFLLQMLGVGDAAGTAATGASNLMNLAYTRAAEAAADATAIDVLTKAGLRADGLSRFFAKLEQREDDLGHGAAILGWLETHPPSASRRERTARPDTGANPFTEPEWQAIRSMCGSMD